MASRAISAVAELLVSFAVERYRLSWMSEEEEVTLFIDAFHSCVRRLKVLCLSFVDTDLQDVFNALLGGQAAIGGTII